MAKLKMKCIELLAPLEQSKEIIDCLQRMGTVELTDCEESESLCKLSTGVTVSTFERYLAAAESAQKTLDKYAPEKGTDAEPHVVVRRQKGARGFGVS